MNGISDGVKQAIWAQVYTHTWLALATPSGMGGYEPTSLHARNEKRSRRAKLAAETAMKAVSALALIDVRSQVRCSDPEPMEAFHALRRSLEFATANGVHATEVRDVAAALVAFGTKLGASEGGAP